MAFSQDSEKFNIKEGLLKVGTGTNLHLIGTNNTDPTTFFSGTVLGWIKQGTIAVNINRTYAMFKARTPAVMVRKDLIEKTFTLAFASGQFDADTLELTKGTLSQKAYSVTIPGVQTWDLHHLGSDEPVQTPQTYMLDSELTDGKRFIVMVYYGRSQAEDISLAFSGTDYTVNNGTITAFPNPSHSGVTNEYQKHYGLIAYKVA